MRLLVVIILMLKVQSAAGQLDSLNITITELSFEEDQSPEYLKACEEGKQRARQDVQSGLLKVERYLGLTFTEIDFDFEEFYSNYLISRYGIEQEMTGCLTERSQRCYLEEMNKTVAEKLGLTLDKIKQAAREEYGNFKLLDNEGKKKYIDFNYVYSKVDERAAYESEIKYLKDKLRSKVDFKKFNFSKFNLKGFHTEVVIDEWGNVISCKVVSADFPPDADQAVQKAIKEIGGWIPATLYGSKVKSRTGFSFIF